MFTSGISIWNSAMKLCPTTAERFVLPLQKATQQVLEQAEPMAKDITQGLITPGAKALAENAVPITEEASSQSLPT